MLSVNKTPFPLAWPIVTVLFSLLAMYLIFGVYFTHPNQHMFAFGGDAYVIYFDMLYHLRHGTGTMFTGMNYPHGEYIFLTDMQGAVTLVLQWLKNVFPSLDEHLVGAVHRLNQVALALGSLFVFYILRHFQVRRPVAALFAVLIIFLSPQMLRFGGHFGLAYPFIIPMAMLWALRKKQVSKFEIWDLVVFFTLVFFAFNNPYVGFCTAGFLLCVALVMVLWRQNEKTNWKPAAIIGAVAFSALLLPFIDFKMSDPVTDRIAQQWGFFHYRATIEGLFAPPKSLISQGLGAMGVKVKQVNFSSWINFGLVGSLALVAMLWAWGRNIFQRKKVEAILPHGLRIFMAAALLLFLYAANYTLYGFAKPWMEEHLGPLLMFKASGRFAWPLYFAIAIASVVFLEKYLRKIKTPVWSVLAVLAVATIWGLEIHQYLYLGRKLHGRNYTNSFHPNKEKEIADVLSANNIDPAGFQAILTAPKILEWNDNLICPTDWNAQFFSLRISALTGLPLINASLSRISLGQASEVAQLYSHPIIERELPKKLPNRKDLLLVVGGGHVPLTDGDRHLIGQASPLFESELYSLFRLPVDSLSAGSERMAARSKFAERPNQKEDFIQLSFAENESAHSFYGQGSFSTQKGLNIILDTVLQVEKDTSFTFSAWTRLDHEKYGQGTWHLWVAKPDGTALFHDEKQARSGYDVQTGWIRTEMEFPAVDGARLKIGIKENRPLDIDEVLVRSVGSEVFTDAPSEDGFLYNGYWIRKKGSWINPVE